MVLAIALPRGRLLLLLLAFVAPAPAAHAAAAAPTANRYGMGVYNDTAGPDIALQLPEAAALVGDGGTVLLYFELQFAKDGDPGSCKGGCLPAGWQVSAVRQAYALNLRVLVRLDQWSRRIRDFADAGAGSSSSPHQNYTRLAAVYRTFVEALPLPPDGKPPLTIQLLNEPNGCIWECDETQPGSFLPAQTAAAEVASCFRDLLAALRTLPRLALAVAPLAQVGFSRCECTPPFKPIVPQNTSQLSFAAQMLAAVPELYDNVDYIIVHACELAGCSRNPGHCSASNNSHKRCTSHAARRAHVACLVAVVGLVMGCEWLTHCACG